MTDRFPLIINSEDQQIQELSSGDNLDLTGSGIVADVFTVDTNSEERLRIDSSGNVLIGGTTQATADIALNADGSATFDGAVNVNLADGSTSDGFAVRSGAKKRVGIDAAGDIKLGDDIYSAQTILLRGSDGSATFASGTSNAAGVEISKNNSNASYAPLYLKQANTSGNLITGRDDFNGVNTFTVSATGSATFASYVESDLFSVSRSSVENKDNYSSKLSIADTGKHFNAKDTGGTTVASINADGSATFGNSPVAFSFTSGYSGGLDLSKDGYSKFAVDTTGNLTSNGSADFAGTINIANYDVSTDANGVSLKSSGQVEAQCDSLQPSTFRLFRGTRATTEVFNVMADGSASFNGMVKTGSDNAGIATGTWLQDIGGVYTTRPAGSTASAFACFQQGGSSYTASINADGSVFFARGNFQMDTAGIIQTNLYSAGTLNIDSSGSFGNPKIVLNASNGNGTFAGGVGGDYVFINRNTTAANLLQASFGYNNTTTTLVKGNGIFLGTSLGDANGTVPTGTNLRLLTDGNGTFAGTVTESGSDRKFKENIVDAPAQLTEVSALQLRTWDWNDLTPGNEERNNRRSMGLVAQEAELIDSNLVYDVNEGEDTYKAVDYKVLTMKLLGAVKELAAKNETLEQRLSDAGIA